MITLFYTIYSLDAMPLKKCHFSTNAALFCERYRENNSGECAGDVPAARELLCLLVCPVPHIITFLDSRGSRHTIVWVCLSSAACVIAEGTQCSLFYMACTFLSWCYECLQGFADARCVCIPSLALLPLPLVPAWAQGLNQSIRAPGTGAQQSLCAAQRSAALSGLVHLQPGGELGEKGEPRCPLHAGFTQGLLGTFVSAQVDLWHACLPQIVQLHF